MSMRVIIPSSTEECNTYLYLFLTENCHHLCAPDGRHRSRSSRGTSRPFGTPPAASHVRPGDRTGRDPPPGDSLS